MAVADLGTNNPGLTPEKRRALERHVENLVWGLFGKTSYPPFDMGGMAVGRVDEFVSSKETFDATLAYINDQCATSNLLTEKSRTSAQYYRHHTQGGF